MNSLRSSHRWAQIAIRRHPALTTAVLFALSAVQVSANDRGGDWYAEQICWPELHNAASELQDLSREHADAGDPGRAGNAVREAARLFRFHRREGALSSLDRASELLNGVWGRTLDAKGRTVALARVADLRRCYTTQQPSPLATLTVRTFLFDADAPRHVGAPAAGAPVEVEEVRMGETGPDGALTVQVPPGELHVNALWPSGDGEAFVTLGPGTSGAVSVVIDPDKKSVQRTELVLVEAVNDVLPRTAASFALKFVRDGHVLPIREIEAIDLVDAQEQHLAFMHHLFTFTAADGTIAATDPAAVYAFLAKYAGQRLGFAVEMLDGGSFAQGNTVWFRMAAGVTSGQGSDGALPDNACGQQWTRAGKAFDALGKPYRGHLLARLSRATALFRFQRTTDAIRMLDRGDEKLAGSWTQELRADKRIEAVEALTAFRTCISSTRPPAFGTLTVHVFEEDDTRPDGRGEPASAGVVIRVEGRDVGRTGADGILTAKVPSGTVEVLGIIPPSDVGYTYNVRVRPAAETTTELILRSGAEPAEDTDLALVEAPDDVLLHTAKSFTLKFMRDDVFVPMTQIEEVALVLDAQREEFEFLPDDLFAVQDGAIVATNVHRVFETLVSHAAGTVRVRVTALDGQDFVHSADVQFRIR